MNPKEHEDVGKLVIIRKVVNSIEEYYKGVIMAVYKHTNQGDRPAPRPIYEVKIQGDLHLFPPGNIYWKSDHPVQSVGK